MIDLLLFPPCVLNPTRLRRRLTGALKNLVALDVRIKLLHPTYATEHARRKLFVVLHSILHETHADLLQIVHATDATRTLARSGKSGKQNRGQNRDDGDDDQQFDERETFLVENTLVCGISTAK